MTSRRNGRCFEPELNSGLMDEGEHRRGRRKEGLMDEDRRAEVSALMHGATDKDYYCIWRMRHVRMKASRRE